MPPWELRTYESDMRAARVVPARRLQAIVRTHVNQKNPLAVAGATFYRCPICETPRPPFALVEVSSLPHELTGGAAYACDGCWTKWEREERVLSDGRVFDEALMYEIFNAPPTMIAQTRESIASVKALRRIR